MIIEYNLHIFLSILQTYIVHLYLKSFFKDKNSSKNLELISYSLYFVFRVIIKLCIRIPLAIVFYDFLGALILAVNYKSPLKKRIFYVSFICLIFITTNGIAALIVPRYNPSILMNTVEYSFYASIISKLMNLFIIFIFKVIRDLKDKLDLEIIIRGILICIPFSTLFVLVLIYESNNIPIVLKLISIILSLLFNFLVFYIFNSLTSYFENKWKSRELERQTIFYENQLNLTQKNLTQMSILRHDLKNHVSVVLGLVKQNKNKECIEYLEKISSLLGTDNVIAKSGNVVIDSLINYKRYELQRNHIDINVSLKIPSEINISSFDIATIIGNLIDNAIEGAVTITENRYISINIIQNKGMINIRIQNSFDGNVKEVNGKILSRKREFTTVGTGLDRVLKLIDIYNGLLEYEIEEDKFTVRAIIYIPQ